MMRTMIGGGRILVVAGLVAATTSTVWVKVQLAETAIAAQAARDRAETLREERSKLQANVDLALRPGSVQARAERELSMTFPPPASIRDLYVGGLRD